MIKMQLGIIVIWEDATDTLEDNVCSSNRFHNNNVFDTREVYLMKFLRNCVVYKSENYAWPKIS